MKTLIIYAHPKTKGYNSYILSNTIKLLKDKKEDYEILDLYKENFNSNLQEKEHYTSGNRYVSLYIKKIQRKIKISNKLIFIYPVWWGGVPAILKGFFDRVFTPGFSHKFITKTNYKKLLKNKKASVICTTGAPKLAYSFGFANRGVKSIKKDILGFCGIKSKIYLIGNCTNQITEKKKKEINKIIKKSINF